MNPPLSPNTIESSYLILRTLQDSQTIALRDKTCWTIGRSKDNDITILDDTISRNHAILQTTDNGEFLLIDLGSSNGTFVNGRRVSVPIQLHHEDQITFGQTQLEFHSAERASAPGPPPNLSKDTQTSVLHERRLMSVMVADMRNFTGLSRQMDEQVLSVLIGNWFRQAGHILRQADSWVDKYIGDAIMGIWFHPEDRVNSTEVLKILTAIKALNSMTKKMNKQYSLPFPLKIGVGLNTGFAMVGNTGSGDHPDYTAIGDTVNAAFRLESATKNLGCDLALGDKSYSYLHQFHQVTQYFREQSVELKGYEEPMLVYSITFPQLTEFVRLNQSFKTQS
ncbi:MAG: FHA domain-containing protein [Microcystaceae cyanobacterium]|nr:adenylate/guanylate cyclase domain-containing protein [Merismopediaceae bacterium]